jgi:hypothetical protein
MKWFVREWLLFRLAGWPGKVLKLLKYSSTLSSFVSLLVKARPILVLVRNLQQGTSTFESLLTAAHIPSISFAIAVTAAFIDHRAAIFDKLGSQDIRRDEHWKSVYRKLNKQAQTEQCKVEEFDGMAGWTNPSLNRQLLLASARGDKIVNYRCGAPRWVAYERDDDGQKSQAAKLRQYVVERAINQGHRIFNDPKVRLSSDIDSSLGETVRLQRTDYISSMMTDGIAFERIYDRTSDIPISDGYSFFLEELRGQPRLKSLLDSASSNQLGASTLAFSSDGFLVLTDQTERNQHSGGKLSPSGSGSFDWSDVEAEKGGDFITLVKKAAARELMEETGLDQDPNFDSAKLVQDHLVIIGFTRLIHRAGKPEFFCLARIDKTMAEIGALVPKRRERKYTQKTLCHDAAALSAKGSLKDEITRVCHHYFDSNRDPSERERTRRHRLSYQVMHGMALLVACLEDEESLQYLQKVLAWPAKKS